MSFGKGSNTTTQTTAPNPAAMQSYQDLMSRASGVAQTPYQAYGGEGVAGVNQQQTTGIGGINQNAGFAQPFIQQAAGYANNAAQPLTAAQIQQYQSPYTQQVVDATMKQFQNSNAMQQQQVLGNAASQGALGGDRVGVAQGVLAGQQQTAQAPVIAGLYNQGYTQAAQMAQQQQQNQANAAYSLGNLGVAGQNAALTGANAQIGAGSLQQGTQQAQDTYALQQFMAQQAFPYQQTQWLAGLDTGVGSQMGGTSTTTGPPPNPWSALLGLGAAGVGAAGSAGAFRAHGGRIAGFADGGAPSAMGGMPYMAGVGYVPTVSLAPGNTMPHPSGGGSQQSGQASSSPGSMLSMGSNIGKMFGSGSGAGASEATNVGLPEDAAAGGFGDWAGSIGTGIGDAASGVGSAIGEGVGALGSGIGEGLGAAGEWLGSLFAGGEGAAGLAALAALKRGGRVRGYDDGGVVQAGFGTGSIVPNDLAFDDRFASVNFTREPKGLDSSDRIAPVDAATDIGTFTRPGVPDRFGTNDYGPPTVSDAGVAPMPRARPPEAQQAYEAGLVTPGGELPANATPTVGVGAAPSPAPSQGGFGPSNISSAGWNGLMAAGLGMMASKSPFLGVAVGEGGLQGLHTYAGQKQQEATESHQKAQTDLAAKRLAQDADKAAKELSLHTAQFAETRKQHEEALNKPVAVQGALVNPKTGEIVYKGNTALLDNDTIKDMAGQYLAGDKSVMQNLGRGAQGAENIVRLRSEIMRQGREGGLSPAQIATKMAEFEGTKASERTLGVQEAKMGTAGFEAKGAIKLARDVIDKVPRTGFLPFNRLIQGYQNQTLSPDQAELFTRTQGVINTYAAVMARGANVTTDSSRHRAEELLNTASDSKVYNRVLDTMESEIDMALHSPQQMREFFRKREGDKAVAPAGAAPVQSAPGATQRSPQDQQALDWATANPNDPRAAAIKQRLGVQ